MPAYVVKQRILATINATPVESVLVPVEEQSDGLLISRAGTRNWCCILSQECQIQMRMSVIVTSAS